MSNGRSVQQVKENEASTTGIRTQENLLCSIRTNRLAVGHVAAGLRLINPYVCNTGCSCTEVVVSPRLDKRTLRHG